MKCICGCIWQNVLDGYNGSVMAYGQTGTGKTCTLGRLGEEGTADRGIMVSAMEDILAEISLETETVSVSYLQSVNILEGSKLRPR
nr:armadillo repeat-containing kinesin-like protein 3 [Ipomoea batatas]